MALQRKFDLNLMDEGFLWYGAQRVLVGELPLRDFQAYDPGRYFWSAAWMALLADDGIVTLRLSNAALGAITVFFAAWTVGAGPVRPRPGALLAAGTIFVWWMAPAFKAADSFAAVVLLWGLTRLAERPTLPRYFAAGLCWGLAATIGINHALYGSIAGLLAFLYLRGAPNALHALLAGGAGAVVGYSPVLALHLFARGFTAAFIDSIRLLFEYGTTNFALPLPSLFALRELPEKGYLMPMTEAASALVLLLAPIFWASAAWHLRRPKSCASLPPAVLAGFVLSLPYAHYAWSRADAGHLAVSILPVLGATLAWVTRAPRVQRWPLLAAAFGLSLLVTLHMHPGYARLRAVYLTETVQVGRDQLLVPPYTAAAVQAVRQTAAAAGPGSFFAGPYLPGAYALASRRSPTWENYMIFPASARRQTIEIERLRSAGVLHALLWRQRWDNRSDLGLAQTHPLVFAFLRSCLPNTRMLSTEFVLLSSSDVQSCRRRPGWSPDRSIITAK